MKYIVVYHQNPLGSDRASYWLIYGPSVTFTHVDPEGELVAIFRDKVQAEAWIDQQEAQ
jgi:hypothetical protein